MVTNAQRAEWAQVAATAFRDVCKGDRDHTEVTDLIVDLLHLARRKWGMDPATVAERAVRMHDEEAAQDDEE